MKSLLSLLKEAIEDDQMSELNRKRKALRSKVFKTINEYLKKYPTGTFADDAKFDKEHLFQAEDEIQLLINDIYNVDSEDIGNIKKILLENLRRHLIELEWVMNFYSNIDDLRE